MAGAKAGDDPCAVRGASPVRAAPGCTRDEPDGRRGLPLLRAGPRRRRRGARRRARVPPLPLRGAVRVRRASRCFGSAAELQNESGQDAARSAGLTGLIAKSVADAQRQTTAPRSSASSSGSSRSFLAARTVVKTLRAVHALAWRVPLPRLKHSTRAARLPDRSSSSASQRSPRRSAGCARSDPAIGLLLGLAIDRRLERGLARRLVAAPAREGRPVDRPGPRCPALRSHRLVDAPAHGLLLLAQDVERVGDLRRDRIGDRDPARALPRRPGDVRVRHAQRDPVGTQAAGRRCTVGRAG